jgi:DNA-binding transcriptional ArsR family regulator
MTPPQPVGVPSTPDPDRPLRHLDARGLRALAHPLRVRILELLDRHGPATSTTLARRLGENTGTVSWHLRHLNEHGFITEDPTRGTRRERWWAPAPSRLHLETADLADDPETRTAAAVYVDALLRRAFDRATRSYAADPGDAWRRARTTSERTDLAMTPAQLAALNTELADVVARHANAAADAPGPDTRPVAVQIQAFPLASDDPAPDHAAPDTPDDTSPDPTP